MMIAVTALDENRSVRQTLRIHFATHVVQMHSLPYVASRVFDRGISIHITELTQAEPVAVIRGIREAVYDDRM